MRTLISDKAEEALVKAQMDLSTANVPVLVIVEGGSGRVNSRVVNEISRLLEPRSVKYYHFDVSEDGPKAIAHLLMGTPAQGEVSLFDRSWYSVILEHFNGGKDLLKDKVEALNRFEKYLMDNGTFIVKICLKVTADSMEKYADDYRPFTSLNNTFLSVDKVDRVKFALVMDDIISMSDNERAPWDIVDVDDPEDTVKKVAEILTERLTDCLDGDWREADKCDFRKDYPNPRRGLILDMKSPDSADRMEKLSEKLEKLQIMLAVTGRSLICCFEGWDAAGKGGCIKHCCHALNPRGYRVMRVGVPNAVDKAHTHLWRFAEYLPSPGRITFFDRTWYGRMMVEPIEGYCTKEEYERSADEINGFDKMLTDSGAILLKFWLDISNEEQLRRFTDRSEDPLKRWKITDSDWRNRDKWDTYESYIDDMISSTNTEYAPWNVIPAENKKYAQLAVLGKIVEVLDKEIQL